MRGVVGGFPWALPLNAARAVCHRQDFAVGRELDLRQYVFGNAFDRHSDLRAVFRAVQIFAAVGVYAHVVRVARARFTIAVAVERRGIVVGSARIAELVRAVAVARFRYRARPSRRSACRQQHGRERAVFDIQRVAVRRVVRQAVERVNHVPVVVVAIEHVVRAAYGILAAFQRNVCGGETLAAYAAAVGRDRHVAQRRVEVDGDYSRYLGVYVERRDVVVEYVVVAVVSARKRYVQVA